jgi:outer membrane protein TolC
MVRPRVPSFSLFVSVCSLTFSATAHAGGLDTLLARAAEVDPRLAAATAEAEVSAAQVGQARAALLPRLTASAGYTRNEVASEVELPGEDPVVITPLDQLDATVRLDVPLVDLGAWSALAAAADCRDAAAAQASATAQATLLAVAQAAWDLRTAALARDAAAAAVTANERVLARVTARREAGTGAAVDLLRATADLAQTRGALAEADADLAAARRALAARTGVDTLPADLAPRARPDGDLDAGARARPEVEAARATVVCRARTVTQNQLGIAPTLAGFAQERVSNATGFAGQATQWSAGATVSWTPLEGGRRAALVAEAAASKRVAEAGLLQREQEARDALADARARLDAAGLSLDAARVRRDAADAAATDAQSRFEAGTGGAVDVSLALGDALDAAVDLARAEARQALAVESLRVAAGQPLRLAGGAR